MAGFPGLGWWIRVLLVRSSPGCAAYQILRGQRARRVHHVLLDRIAQSVQLLINIPDWRFLLPGTCGAHGNLARGKALD